MNKKTSEQEIVKNWISQARSAIDQGRSLNEFVLNAHPINRRLARKAYLEALLMHDHLRGEHERWEDRKLSCPLCAKIEKIGKEWEAFVSDQRAKGYAWAQ